MNKSIASNNGQIADLQLRLEEATRANKVQSAVVSKLQATVQQKDRDISALNGTITSSKFRIKSLENEVATLTAERDHLAAKAESSSNEVSSGKSLRFSQNKTVHATAANETRTAHDLSRKARANGHAFSSVRSQRKKVKVVDSVVEVSDDISSKKTLSLLGLRRDMIEALEEIARVHKCESVRYPKGWLNTTERHWLNATCCAQLHFSTHEKASRCLSDLQGEIIMGEVRCATVPSQRAHRRFL